MVKEYIPLDWIDEEDYEGSKNTHKLIMNLHDKLHQINSQIFDNLFSQTGVYENHEVWDLLVKDRVAINNDSDNEMGCLYIYFSSKKTAINFVTRLNKWIAKKLGEP